MTKIKLQIRNRWKPVCKTNGQYLINPETGDVYSLRSNRLLRPFISNKGYILYHIVSNGVKKNLSAHRMVYESIFGLIPNGYEIDHIDGNKLNNNIDNLRLCTSRENKHNPATVAARHPAKTWRSITVTKDDKEIGRYPSIRECARHLKIGRRDIQRCLSGVYHGKESCINGIHFFINKQDAINY